MDHRMTNVRLFPDFMQFTELQYLSLYNGSLPGPIPTELGQFKKLEYLNLGMNQFSGGVPSEFAQLTNLKELIITDNTFMTGTIPSELGNLQNLEKLQLSRNSLTGTVPESLLSLSKLRDLELQNNLLSGPLPPLLRLNGKLDVSANCFDGQTPWNFRCPKVGAVSATTGVVSGTGGAGNSNSENAPPANNMAGMIGAVVGGLAALIVLVVAFVFFRKSRSKGAIQKDEAPRNAAVRYDSDLVKIKVNDNDQPASFTSLPQQVYDSKHVPSAYLNSNSGSSSSSSSQLPETISGDLNMSSSSTPKNLNSEDPPEQQLPLPADSNNHEQIEFFAPAPGASPNYYAITESGMSSLTDPRRAVTSYRLLPEKNRAFASATESDLASSRPTYAADEKVSYSGGAQLMAEPMDENEGGDLEPSFLDTLSPGGFSAAGRGRGGALDEKAMLRGAAAVPEKSSALFNGLLQRDGLNEGQVPGDQATDAAPLPGKESMLFQALHNPEETNARSQQTGGELNARVIASWSIEQVAEWAAKIERGGVGVKFAELVKQHQVTGQVLLQLTREDLRTDFGLNITDRLVVDDCIRQLKASAGVGVVPQERDAGALPPSYSAI
ncbi:hypothetical protein HDU80_002660 [Chytriomyces hyalinus]|nr:hypothetical protein HDU80_002660 [Chytriomyces hyalinus]